MEKNSDERLATGTIVCHVKYDRKYRVVSDNCRMKDSRKGWILGVAYTPLLHNDGNVFVRARESFLREFEVVKEIEESGRDICQEECPNKFTEAVEMQCDRCEIKKRHGVD